VDGKTSTIQVHSSRDALIFVSCGVALYADLNRSLTQYLSSVVFAILMIVDLPFSIVAFGVMFGGGRNETIAFIAWGIGCTLWWHLLGRCIDALRRRSQNT
jgi:hypothetical protein